MQDYQIYPQSDVEKSIKNQKLQKEFELPRNLKEAETEKCNFCKDINLKWYRFVSPPKTWQMKCGRDCWLLICPECKRQYNQRIIMLN